MTARNTKGWQKYWQMKEGVAGFKHDASAREHWGSDLYDRIPKSVFAVAAWHLANIASEQPDGLAAAEARFRQEIEALTASGLIPERQGKAALAAIRRAWGIGE